MSFDLVSYQLADLDSDKRDGIIQNWKYDFPDNPLLPVVEKLADMVDALTEDVNTAETSLDEYDNRIESLKCLLPEFFSLVDGLEVGTYVDANDLALLRNVATEIDKL